jgi:hypothetical protein
LFVQFAKSAKNRVCKNRDHADLAANQIQIKQCTVNKQQSINNNILFSGMFRIESKIVNDGPEKIITLY